MAFLLTWSPTRWSGGIEWVRDAAAKTKAGHLVEDGDWSTARVHGYEDGDRVFLLKQVAEPRGIIASGYVAGEVYEDRSFDNDGAVETYIPVIWEVVLQEHEPLLTTDLQRIIPTQHWTPQASGTKIHPDVEADVEALWEAHLKAVGRLNP